MDYKEVYEQWLSNPYFDEATKEELKNIAEQISVLSKDKNISAEQLRSFLPDHQYARLPVLAGGDRHQLPRVPYAAVPDHADRAGLHIQEIPRTQGGGRSLRQGSAITESTVCASKSVFPHCGKTLFLCFFSAEK